MSSIVGILTLTRMVNFVPSQVEHITPTPVFTCVALAKADLVIARRLRAKIVLFRIQA